MRRHRSLVARWAQPEVEFVEDALGGGRRYRRDEALRHARVVVRRGERLCAIRFLGVRIVIVEQDQVDVRPGGQLAAAELAHAEDRDPAPRDAAVPARELRLDGFKCCADREVGKIGKGLAGAAGVDRACKQPHADQEFLLRAEDAQPVEHLLVFGRAVDERRKPGRQVGAIRQFREQRRVEQPVENMRPARDDAGQPGRGAHDGGKQLQQAGIGLQQREKLDAGRQAGEELVEAHQRLVGLACLAESLQQGRRQFGQPFARLGRLGGAVAAEMPAAYDPANVARPPEAKPRQRAQRIGVVHVAGEDQIADARRKLGCGLEQRRVVALDFLQRCAEGRGKFVGALEAEHPGDAFQPFVGFGQRVRLLVRHHLDRVLDAAQEPVLRGHGVTGVGGDPAARGKFAKHRHRGAPAQFGKPPAGDQLLGLHEELDLADAAATEFHVVTLHRDLAVPLVRVDLALDRMHVGDCRIVQIFAPDIGLQLPQEGLARRDVAGKRPRLDHGGALPVLATAFVVVERRLDRDGERGRAGIGPQAQVGAEDIAVLRAVLENAQQPARQAHEQVGGLHRVDDGRRFGIEEHDQIDVGRKVELARAELAHAKDHPAGTDAGVVRIRRDGACPGGVRRAAGNRSRR